MKNLKRSSKKIFIAISGGVVTLIGLILVPYPGPGWLIVFAGLAILATEFEFAARLLESLKAKYDQWILWAKKQNPFTQFLLLLLTVSVVAVTVWLLNGFGIINSLFSLNSDWLISPLFR